MVGSRLNLDCELGTGPASGPDDINPVNPDETCSENDPTTNPVKIVKWSKLPGTQTNICTADPMQQHNKNDVSCMMNNVGRFHIYKTGTTDMVCLFYTTEIEVICRIDPDVEIADAVGPNVFGYQFYTTVSVMLEYNQNTHDHNQFSTLETSFSVDIYLTASSRDDDMTCNGLHSRYESTYSGVNIVWSEMHRIQVCIDTRTQITEVRQYVSRMFITSMATDMKIVPDTKLCID